MRQKHLNLKKNIYCYGYPTSNGQSSIIAEAVNKQNSYIKITAIKTIF